MAFQKVQSVGAGLPLFRQKLSTAYDVSQFWTASLLIEKGQRRYLFRRSIIHLFINIQIDYQL